MAKFDPKDMRLKIEIDMSETLRHFFGIFGWRKWLAVRSIKFGAWLIKCDIDFKGE